MLSIESIEDKQINESLKKILNIVEMEQERSFISNAELFDHLLTAFSIESKLTPNNVCPDYVGVHLGSVYEDNDLRLLLKSFKHNQVLDPYYTLKILNDAKQHLSKLPNIQECSIDDPNDPGCIVIGDLHGNFDDLNHIITKYGLPGEKFKFIFNGDIIDRGSKQVECLLIILYSFLIRPDRVFINRGNHEDISMNSSSNFNPNFLSKCKKLYAKYSSCIYTTTNDLFTCLPLATSLENNISKFKYFIVHGGISDDLDLDFVYTKVNRFKFDKIINNGKKGSDFKAVSNLLWSDPSEKQGCLFNKTRNLGCLFGPDTTDKFCKKYGYNGIIRSHEVRDKGYSEDHPRCFTVFSASYYCGGFNYGSVFKITHDPTFEVYTYKNLSGDLTSLVHKRDNYLLKKFKGLIQQKEEDLFKKFELFDLDKSGFIKTDLWADIVSKSFDSQITAVHLKSIKDMLCECETKFDLVNYKSLFRKREKLRTNEESHFLSIVENLFDILDWNNDKKISVGEARDALDYLNKHLGTKFLIHDDCVNFIKQMDKNGDNYVDLDEFKRAFMGASDDEQDLDAENSDSECSDDDNDICILRV